MLRKTLRIARAERDLSQRDVASAMGISLNRYWRIENDETLPSLPELRQLAKILVIRFDELRSLVFGGVMG